MVDSKSRADKSLLLDAALQSIPYGFCVWSSAFRLVMWNTNYLDIYGFPASRIRKGMTLAAVVKLSAELGNHPDQLPDAFLASYRQELINNRSGARAKVRELVAGGRTIETGHVFSPGLGWVVTHEDVTEEIASSEIVQGRKRELERQNIRFEAAVRTMPLGLSMYDAQQRLVICNEHYASLYDLTPELVRPGTLYLEILEHRTKQGTYPANSQNDYVARSMAMIADGEVREMEVKLRNGKTVSVTHHPMADGGFLGTHRDITDEIARLRLLRAKKAQLTRQNIRLDAAVNNIGQGLCMYDAKGRLVICNEPYQRIYNLPEHLLKPGTQLEDILAHLFRQGMHAGGDADAYVHWRREVISRGEYGKNIHELNGRTILMQHHPMKDGGWVSTHEDITEQRQQDARIRHLARHDSLTELPNRSQFLEEMAAAEAGIARGEPAAVLCIDLDHFKSVNDTLGHAVGDKVLQQASARLWGCTRDNDVLARLGGDEFALLLRSIVTPAEAAAIAERIVKAMSTPFILDGHQVAIGASIGIALAPQDGNTTDVLMKNADLALYRAKGEGRSTFHFFEPGMDAAVQKRRAIEAGLRLALVRNELRLVFQPLVGLQENRITCLEALLRWDPTGGIAVSPTEFIPVAEETGMIVPIGEWVLRQACQAAAGWPGDVRVAVNLSVVQFKNKRLFETVQSALAEAGLDPRRLELEITESLLLTDNEPTLATLHKLRALGIRISMDDFGTGYSSLSYLRSFPFDKIKIDRSFMHDLKAKGDNLAIIKAVIGLGHSLGMATTAEGIETEEQLQAVREQGCNEVQGFLFSPPLAPNAVAGMLATEREPLPELRFRRDSQPSGA